MSIVITIEGNHPTDVLAQLKQLAEGLCQGENTLSAPVAVGQEEPTHIVGGINKDSNEFWKSGIQREKTTEESAEISKDISTEKPKKLAGLQHKQEADKMIAAGKIDEEIYALLSKAQKERVDAILNPVAVDPALPNSDQNVVSKVTVEEGKIAKIEPAKEADVAGLFDDEDESEDEVATLSLDDLRKLIVKKCKDSNGKDIPEMYAAVRAEIKNVVAKDQEPKISNVPELKYSELYKSINSLSV